jgi:hypothetical protein
MYDVSLDTKTLPSLGLHIESGSVAETNETLYRCLMAANNAFGYSE